MPKRRISVPFAELKLTKEESIALHRFKDKHEKKNKPPYTPSFKFRSTIKVLKDLENVLNKEHPCYRCGSVHKNKDGALLYGHKICWNCFSSIVENKHFVF